MVQRDCSRAISDNHTPLLAEECCWASVGFLTAEPWSLTKKKPWNNPRFIQTTTYYDIARRPIVGYKTPNITMEYQPNTTDFLLELVLLNARQKRAFTVKFDKPLTALTHVWTVAGFIREITVQGRAAGQMMFSWEVSLRNRLDIKWQKPYHSTAC